MVLISEVAKRSDKLGALIAVLPTVTIFVLVWMYFEGQTPEKISDHVKYTFWYVVRMLSMFLVFLSLNKGFGFWLALVVCCFITIVCFAITVWIGRFFSINIM